jgi:hypothetical protein
MNGVTMVEHKISERRCGVTLERGFGRGDWIRTSDLLNPIQVRYQTALRPDSRQV